MTSQTLVILVVIGGCLDIGFAANCSDVIENLVDAEFKAADTDGDGKIGAMDIVYKMETYDKNQNGQFSKVEVGQLVYDLYPGLRPLVDQVFLGMDDDDDGIVDEVEAILFLVGSVPPGADAATEASYKIYWTAVYEALYKAAGHAPEQCIW